MRELTKSVTSYTWAMSVFWTQQMINVLGLGGSGSWDRSTRAFTHVTEATASEMGDTMRAVFRGGDTLQRGMVDLLLAPLSVVNWGGGSRGGPGNGNGQGGHRAGDGAGGGDGYRASDAYRRNGGDRTGGNTGAGWRETTARVVEVGADVMQATADAAARSTRRAVDATMGQADGQPPSQPQPRRPAAPPSADPSLGWGPMPR